MIIDDFFNTQVQGNRVVDEQITRYDICEHNSLCNNVEQLYFDLKTFALIAVVLLVCFVVNFVYNRKKI